MTAPDYNSALRTAMYLAAEWGDMLPDTLPVPIVPGRPVNALTTGFYRYVMRRTGDFVGVEPFDVLDVGSATGRLLYELSRSMWPIQSLSGCEPSRPFAELARAILLGGLPVSAVPTFGTSTQEVHLMEMPASLGIRLGSPGSLPIQIFSETSEEFSRRCLSFDVVFCLNVIDRHPSPHALVRDLTKLVRQGGLLCMASPFDWQDSPAPPEERADDLRQYFEPKRWHICESFDCDYVLHMTPRKIGNFLSQVVILRSQAVPI